MFDSEFTLSFTRKRRVKVKDDEGTFTTTTSADITFLGKIRRLSTREITQLSGQQVGTTHRIYARPGIDVIAEDVIVYDSVEYQVITKPEDIMQEGILLHLDVKVLNED